MRTKQLRLARRYNWPTLGTVTCGQCHSLAYHTKYSFSSPYLSSSTRAAQQAKKQRLKQLDEINSLCQQNQLDSAIKVFQQAPNPFSASVLIKMIGTKRKISNK